MQFNTGPGIGTEADFVWASQLVLVSLRSKAVPCSSWGSAGMTLFSIPHEHQSLSILLIVSHRCRINQRRSKFTGKSQSFSKIFLISHQQEQTSHQHISSLLGTSKDKITLGRSKIQASGSAASTVNLTKYRTFSSVRRAVFPPQLLVYFTGPRHLMFRLRIAPTKVTKVISSLRVHATKY